MGLQAILLVQGATKVFANGTCIVYPVELGKALSSPETWEEWGAFPGLSEHISYSEDNNSTPTQKSWKGGQGFNFPR